LRSSQDTAPEQRQLKRAIPVLESRHALLCDAFVHAALGLVRAKLAALTAHAAADPVENLNLDQ